MANYLYRRGNGNEGNFIRALVTLSETDNAYVALKALLLNDYIVGRVRRYIQADVVIDGEADYLIYATVYEGPKGETAFGAAWLTAELQLLNEKDSAYYRDHGGLLQGDLKSLLDAPAWRLYRKESRAEAQAA